jgi:hypothetical protein
MQEKMTGTNTLLSGISSGEIGMIIKVNMKNENTSKILSSPQIGIDLL